MYKRGRLDYGMVMRLMFVMILLATVTGLIKSYALKKNASKNGINLIYYNRKQTIKIEPQLNVYSSLFSPTTGTLDVHQFMLNLENDIIIDKGLVAISF